jgi:hypothetical protein
MNRWVGWAQTYPRALLTPTPTSSPPPEADGGGRPGLGGTIVGHVLCACPGPQVLMAADVGEAWHATEAGRGLSDQGPCAIEGIRRHTVPPAVGRWGLARRKPAQGEWRFGGILGLGRRFRGPLLWGAAVLLEPLCLLRPRPEFGGWLREAKAHGQGALGGHQDEQDQAWSPQRAPTFLGAQFREMGEGLGRCGARVVGVIAAEAPRGETRVP